ncbi:MAG: prepilin-type N-terminal cleavage/methylation domain-containing protein [Candidatus Omnitrophica bacterium]|nr:prepilin-type N-terminal cleavage/methylation domain-containing protein [Candidatus Omnitrophota bacterium]
MSKKSGFTLVEIMIVIAIVALLAAIAIPSHIHLVRRARASEAIATMTMVRQALRDYSIYHSGILYDVASDYIQAPVPTGTPTSTDGVGIDVGIAQYFSNAAFSVDSTLPAWTDTSISPGPSGFIVRVDGNASSSDCTGTPVNCAMHSDVVADFDLEMDNTGRVFISYDGTNWTEY